MEMTINTTEPNNINRELISRIAKLNKTNRLILWEQTKGMLNAMLHTYSSSISQSISISIFENMVDKFIEDIETSNMLDDLG